MSNKYKLPPDWANRLAARERPGRTDIQKELGVIGTEDYKRQKFVNQRQNQNLGG